MEYYNKVDDRYLNALKQSIIYPVFKVELMDFAENVIGEITQDISKEDSGSISINFQQGVRRSCSLTLINVNENLSLRKGKYLLNENGLWVNTKFKLYTGIKIKRFENLPPVELDYAIQKILFEEEDDLIYDNLGNQLLLKENGEKIEEDIYWFSQGVFLLTDPNVLRDMSKQTITLNGIDKFGIFGSETNFSSTEAVYKIEANSNVREVVKSILNFDKGNSFKLDVKEPYLDPQTKVLVSNELGEVPLPQATLPFEINKSPETYFSDILIELANVFACDIYYDTEGRLHLEKGNEKIDMEDFNSLWDYSDKEPEYFSPQLNYDFKSVFNVVKVVGDNPSSTNLFEVTLKNEDPSSPTRVALLGEKILYIESSFCYNLQRTKDFANYMLKKKTMVPLTFSFQSSFIPHLDVNKIITITDDYYKFSQQRFVIQSLTIPLTTKSLMDINCTNTSLIPYFEY